MEYGEVKEFHVDEFYPSRWQRRRVFEFERMRDLMEDIDQHGVHDPILFFVNEEGKKELLTGHRRCRASLALQRPMVSREYQVKEACMSNFWQTFAPELRWQGHYKFSVPAREVTGPLDQLHALHARDNLQRADIDTLAIAEMVSDYITEHGATQLEAAQAFGKTQAWVSQMLSLVSLDPEVQEQVTSGKLSQSVAQIIAKLPDEKTQRGVTSALLEAEKSGHLKKLTARAVKEIIDAVRKAIERGAAFWDIPPDAHVPPMFRNCAHVIARAVADRPPTALAETYTNMAINKTLRAPQVMGENQLYALAHSFGVDKLDYTCGLCPAAQICRENEGNKLIVPYAPCSRMFCYMAPDAPFAMQLNADIISVLPCAECPRKFTVPGVHLRHFCTDRECLVEMLGIADVAAKTAAAERAAAKKRLQDARVQERLTELQAHHAEFQRLRREADATEFPFYPRCEECVNWDGTQCQFAVEPEFDRFSERLKLPSFVVYQNGTEDLFPACCDFEYANPANVPEVPDVAMPRELALRLLDELGGRVSIHADVLNAAHFAQLTVPQMVWLMQRSLHHINHDWQTGNTLVDYAGSEARQWKQQNWRDYWDSREN